MEDDLENCACMTYEPGIWNHQNWLCCAIQGTLEKRTWTFVLCQLTYYFLFHNVYKGITAHTMHDKYLGEFWVQASYLNMSAYSYMPSCL